MQIIKRTEHGLKWGDAEITCLCEDNQGRIFLRIKRGRTQTDFYVTKGGKLRISEVKLCTNADHADITSQVADVINPGSK